MLTFWKLHPLFFLGLCFLFGTGIAFGFVWISLFGVICLFYPLFFSRKLSLKERIFFIFSAGTIITVAYLYTCLQYPSAPIDNPIKGAAYFTYKKIKPSKSPFNTTLCLEGKIRLFKTETGNDFWNLPTHIYLPITHKHPPAHCDYIIEGTLIKQSAFHFMLKPKRWHPVEKTHNLAEKRYSLKRTLSKKIESLYQDPKVASLLSGLATGDMENRLLSFEFAKLGLSHLLVISGFHFALITLILAFILRFFFSKKWTAFFLLILTTLYYVYLGHIPSVNRAWVGIALFLTGNLLELPSRPINALGGALCFTFIKDPYDLTTLSLHLSFLATFALLATTPLVEQGLNYLFPKRPKDIVKGMTLLNKQGYLISHTLRKVWSLNLAVFILTCPTILAIFYKFPLLSLIYNLFMPLFLSGILFLFVLGLALSTIHPLLGQPIHIACEWAAKILLDQIAFYPKILDINLYCKWITPTIVCLILIPLILLSIYTYGHNLDQKHTYA